MISWVNVYIIYESQWRVKTRLGGGNRRHSHRDGIVLAVHGGPQFRWDAVGGMCVFLFGLGKRGVGAKSLEQVLSTCVFVALVFFWVIPACNHPRTAGGPSYSIQLFMTDEDQKKPEASHPCRLRSTHVISMPPPFLEQTDILSFYSPHFLVQCAIGSFLSHSPVVHTEMVDHNYEHPPYRT